MAESVYKVIELVGTSTNSWERAAAVAIERASRICETCVWRKFSSRTW